MTIDTRTWHGEPALRLASSELEVIVLPRRGAKIASLIDSAGRQWLAQPEAGALPEVRYGASFTDAEMCGWDEMAPTIVSAGLPDHGEIWAVPWDQVEVTDRAVELSVQGRALPYILRRRIELIAPNEARLTYLATSTGGPIDFLWAAHPQFRAPEGTTIELPAEIHHVIDVDVPDNPRSVPWAGGRIDPFRELREGEAHKVWCRPEDEPTSCILRRVDGGQLTLSWNPRHVPHLGIWADRARWSREPIIAIEPATGYFDDLDRARRLGFVDRLVPDAWTRWSLTLKLSATNLP